MEVLKHDLVIQRLESLRNLDFDKKVLIWVIHADKIPPHLGVSHNNLFYSLKANGKDMHLPVEKLTQVLSKKSIVTVFIEVEVLQLKLPLKDVFERYESTIVGQVTCLQPIKEAFNVDQASWVKELISELDKKDAIVSSFGWNLPDDFERIPDYSPEDIHKRLTELKNV